MTQTKNNILYQDVDVEDLNYEMATLSTRALVTYFQSMQITITERDLLHPTADGTQEIFRTILALVKSWRLKYTPRYIGEDILLAEINAVWPLYYEIKNMLALLGHKDFEPSDLIHPSPQRLARTLSALANFAMFRESRWTVFEERAREIEELAERLESEHEKSRTLDREIEELEAQRYREETEVEQLELDNSEFEQELRNMRAVADALQQELHQQKQKKQNLKDIMADLHLKMLGMNDDIKAYRQRENLNPEKLRESINTLRDSCSTYNTKIKTLESDLQQANRQMEDHAEFEQNLERCSDLLRAIHKLRSECEWQQTTAKEIEDNIDRLMVKSKELQEIEDRLLQTQHQWDATIKKQEIQEEKTRESLHQRFLKSSEEFESIQKEVADYHTEGLQCKARTVELEQELESIRQESFEEYQAVKVKYDELGAAVSSYLDGIIRALENAQPQSN